MLKVLVLGASGFLGTLISQHYEKIYNIIKISRNDLDLYDELKVKEFLETAKIDVVINCASSISKNFNEIDVYKERNNFLIFQSFYNNAHLFKRYINIGSGAEFDKEFGILNFKEEQILDKYPSDSYGFSKNLISRLCLKKEHFYTLRLFSIYHHTEPNFRLFKHICNSYKNKLPVIITDRYQDFISFSDFLKILDVYLKEAFLPKDINCVYQEKDKISNLVKLFCSIKKFDDKFLQYETLNKNYTGDSSKLDSLNLNLLGHLTGIKEYEISS